MENPQLYFKVPEGEDPYDFYLELLMQDKKFFTQKPAISKVFCSRIAKLELRDEAYKAQYGEVNQKKELFSRDFEPDESNPFNQHLSFQRYKAFVFGLIYNSSSVQELKVLVEKLIEAHRRYLTFWGEYELEKDETILLSKEPDPTLFFEHLKSFHEAGGRKLSQLEELDFEGKDLFLLEVKRLSLLHQKENKEWRNSKN